MHSSNQLWWESKCIVWKNSTLRRRAEWNWHLITSVFCLPSLQVCVPLIYNESLHVQAELSSSSTQVLLFLLDFTWQNTSLLPTTTLQEAASYLLSGWDLAAEILTKSSPILPADCYFILFIPTDSFYLQLDLKHFLIATICINLVYLYTLLFIFFFFWFCNARLENLMYVTFTMCLNIVYWSFICYFVSLYRRASPKRFFIEIN